ncbi:MAG: hypothetical protein D6826_06130 [Alphaproteobacteria bacterium]|nr:MAG: hypothetical protein D6826_06130 [Alphaproteobacteria bacterium]
MRNGVRLFAIALVALAPGACTAPALGQEGRTFAWRPVAGATETYDLRGVRVRAPEATGWYVAESGDDMIAFYKRAGVAPPRSVIAFVRVTPIRLASPTPADLRRFVERYQAVDRGHPRVRIRRVETEPAPDLPATCVRSRFEVVDRAVPKAPRKAFLLRGWALYCLHPAAAKPRLVHLVLSQRYPRRKKPLNLESAFRTFVEGLEFISEK